MQKWFNFDYILLVKGSKKTFWDKQIYSLIFLIIVSFSAISCLAVPTAIFDWNFNHVIKTVEAWRLSGCCRFFSGMFAAVSVAVSFPAVHWAVERDWNEIHAG